MANTARNKPGTERITVVEENSAVDNIQVTYEKNKKTINAVVIIILVAILGFFGYKKLYQEPRNTDAANDIFFAQQYFERDSMQQALNGDGRHPGFLRIISKYGNTKSGNLAHYYAGLAYLNMGDFKNAVKHLEDFDGKGTALEYIAYGATGDAYVESGNLKKGIDMYNKAASNKENSVVAALYLFRAGLAYEMNNQPEEAKKAYTRIRDEYPESLQARDMDKYLARLGVLE